MTQFIGCQVLLAALFLSLLMAFNMLCFHPRILMPNHSQEHLENRLYYSSKPPCVKCYTVIVHFLVCVFFFFQTQSRMKLIADSYEEEHIQPQHHPFHSHHMHPANMHHRSLPRGPSHANHRPHLDQVTTIFTHTHPAQKSNILKHGLVYTV